MLTIRFEPITYQVSEAMGAIEVCFKVEENNVLDVAGQAILTKLSGSAFGIIIISQFNTSLVHQPRTKLVLNQYSVILDLSSTKFNSFR